ncbi:hypothetical protein OD762_17125 [Pseudomonas aeruginosa]|uniref:restriction endonuclease subunit S n=1 Tax=Pseudomonas aeruginosa TaxID=287 RepID=UPI000F874846|nr:restriction endonuclease subunit S [Pseudomonas aeruginosa]MCV4360435.1 hypothetical protein [Pseudomonas aeruginosa]RUB01276.1 restriction endonuclease subunit S [Pseudomonas aeruginosa]HBO5504241.1 restriction endonuclease subunit S [Pseudomonas aeruginosa]HBO5540785.1 restriction endonuclease subunit S [Pseudomonas aeruginosa]
MSVDTLRETFHINRVTPEKIQDFLTAQTYRPEITKAKEDIKALPWVFLQHVCKRPIRQGKSPSYADDTGLLCIKPKNTNEMIVSLEELSYIQPASKDEVAGQRLQRGDIVITRSGSGTIGRASIFLSDEEVYTNDHLFIVRTDSADSHYTCAFLNTYWGHRLLEAGISGSTGQLNLSNEHIKGITLYTPAGLAQKYIGDKVRQAERLRAWAKARGEAIEALASNEAIESACATIEKQHNRPQLDDLSHRLDPKYYGNRAVAVFRQAKALGKSLSSLVKGIANGFEERVFFNTGRDYITVTEVSSGRLDLSSAPKIAQTTEVPDKAIIHERCALVVRTGSIGTAVKIDARDRGAVISSHLIRLEFADEADAAAVAAYLCSPAGKVLQHKISYGAVQPQIGQDELLALPIPQFVLDAKEQILTLVTEQESAIRASKSLTTTAKYLVEALIEGQLTEAELLTAEKALQAGSDRLDRFILSRLNTDGIDGQGPALFSDLDELYYLLTLAEGD